MDGVRKTEQSEEKVYTATIRFSPKRPEQKRVIDYIKKRADGVSISEYITAAILHYEETVLKSKKEDVFASIQRLIETTLINFYEKKMNDPRYNSDSEHPAEKLLQDKEFLAEEKSTGYMHGTEDTEAKEGDNQLPDAALNFLKEYL